MPEQLTLGGVIRKAREREGISLRELARRSGVSAGQLSRIESGDVAKPSTDTLRSIARALGRHSVPLLTLAGHLTGAAAVERLTELDEDLAAATEPAAEYLSAEYGGDVLEDETDRRGWAARLFFGSGVDTLGWGLELGEDVESRERLRELVRAWPALTPQRRCLVRAFVADQEVLSALDRMPSAPGRYEIEIQLTDRGVTDAD
jgi:transcriptional regulator with XRE-family HTH domain